MEKEYFKEEISFIESEEVRGMVKEILENVNNEFFHAPASSTGKYHPEYALGDGGLYRHTKAAVKIAHDLLQLEWYQNKFNSLQRDYIIAALILHDSCKSGKNWDNKYTLHTHPLVASTFVKEQVGQSLMIEHGDEISRLISSHMGQWNEPGRWCRGDDRMTLPKPEQDDEFFVHLCDYLASRKYLNVDGLNEE